VFLRSGNGLVWVNDLPDYIMASPLGPARGLIQFWDLFLDHGLADAVAHRGGPGCWRSVVGTLIGMVMGFSRTMRDALYPLLVGFNAIPKATVVPIVALLCSWASMISTRC
jgi:NitT/TauT family transport system permease protein